MKRSLVFALLGFMALLRIEPMLAAPSANPLAAIACPLPVTRGLRYANTDPIPATPSSGAAMIYSTTAPTTSPRLDTLAIVRVGLSLDVYRQGQAWAQLQKQNAGQPNALHVGTALPMDPKDYPTNADDKNIAWEQRQANALELGLQGFPERWPLPTVTVVRGYDLDARRSRFTPQEISEMLTDMVGDELGDAGLHWHEVEQLSKGVICNDTPESTVEAVFQVFERHPDMPALLLYVVEGYGMAYALGEKGMRPIGVGTGPRQPGELTDSVVALVVARPERLDWLRNFAKYTSPNANPIDPAFSGWERSPRTPFNPSPFFPRPITVRGFEQWDRLTVLARLHRPVTVSLRPVGKPAALLKGQARYAALAAGWEKTTASLAAPPARVFFDTGKPGGGLAELAPALYAAHSSLDPLESSQSYDLSQRLGDTGAASPFVGIALATMASYLNADTSIVMPLRRADQATVIAITPPAPGKKPANDPFGVKLRPQHAALTNEPSPEFERWLRARQREYQQLQAQLHRRAMDPAQAAREKRILDDFIAGGPGIDPLDAPEE